MQSILLEAETFSLLLTIATLIAVATITTVTMVTIAISNTIAIHILFRRIRQVKLDEKVATEWLSCLQQAWEDARILRARRKIETMIGVQIFIPEGPV